jgi:hypothetical protein
VVGDLLRRAAEDLAGRVFGSRVTITAILNAATGPILSRMMNSVRKSLQYLVVREVPPDVKSEAG